MGKPNASSTEIKLLSPLLSGYRHVYLEGLTEASIFVHITINEIYGKVRKTIWLKATGNHHMVLNKVIYWRIASKESTSWRAVLYQETMGKPIEPSVLSCPQVPIHLCSFYSLGVCPHSFHPGGPFLGLQENYYSLRWLFAWLKQWRYSWKLNFTS